MATKSETNSKQAKRTVKEYIHPSIIWTITPETRDYIRDTLDSKFRPFLVPEQNHTFVFCQLTELLFNELYDITQTMEFVHYILNGTYRYS